MSWTNDADGDVLRSLEEEGFDFSQEWSIDFNVDFEAWPPSEEAVACLRAAGLEPELVDPEEEGEVGYIALVITSKVNYEVVTQMQAKLSKLMQPYGGWCESWGVFSA